MNNQRVRQLFLPVLVAVLLLVGFGLGSVYGRPATTTAQQPMSSGLLPAL